MTYYEMAAFTKDKDIIWSTYAWEVWFSMTKNEQESCTQDKMERYVEDTYLSIMENGIK